MVVLLKLCKKYDFKTSLRRLNPKDVKELAEAFKIITELETSCANLSSDCLWGTDIRPTDQQRTQIIFQLIYAELIDWAERMK
jgi:hypothetical protein